jgi:LPS O-antigen subunit length determinant protein (WzzB/FepE family)
MQVPRKAGLGVFFLNTSPGGSGTIYIKALMQSSTSVLMAEAAALALAAKIALALGIQSPVFLSDNQKLVTFLNGSDHTHHRLGISRASLRASSINLQQFMGGSTRFIES